jgi:hypothetical protein
LLSAASRNSTRLSHDQNSNPLDASPVELHASCWRWYVIASRVACDKKRLGSRGMFERRTVSSPSARVSSVIRSSGLAC